jgi:hypothetical protein
MYGPFDLNLDFGTESNKLNVDFSVLDHRHNGRVKTLRGPILKKGHLIIRFCLHQEQKLDPLEASGSTGPEFWSWLNFQLFN